MCVCAVMAPKPKTFHPVKFGRSLTISGGHTPGKQYVLDTQEFAFTCGLGVASGVTEVKKECVLVSSQAAWLCEMATGQAVYQRPLSRVNILNEIRQRVTHNSEEPNADGKMAALAFDDDDETLETPKKRKRGKQESTETPAVAGAAICKRIQVPQAWRDKSKSAIYAAIDCKRRLWLDIESLPWLIQYVKEEKESGGVAPVEEKDIRGGGEQADSEASAGAETFRIYWNFRDDGWVARARTVSGSWLQASRGVKRRQKTDGVDFQTAKKIVYEEMEAWVAAVRAGEITATDNPDICDGGK